MSIPKLEVPTFELKLPSTNAKVAFRPFLVKEHKALLMTKDGSEEEVARVVEEIVDICTFKKLNMRMLAHFDIEFIFMNLRAKSISEKLELVINCNNCDTRNPFSVHIPNIQVQKSPEHKTKMMVTHDIGIEMKYPRYSDLADTLGNPNEESLFNLLISCVKGVYSASGDYHEVTVDDKQELQEFFDTMTVTQYEQIKQFIETMPKLSHREQVTCSKCGTINTARLENLTNFFL